MRGCGERSPCFSRPHRERKAPVFAHSLHLEDLELTNRQGVDDVLPSLAAIAVLGKEVTEEILAVSFLLLLSLLDGDESLYPRLLLRAGKFLSSFPHYHTSFLN